jgi:integrase
MHLTQLERPKKARSEWPRTVTVRSIPGITAKLYRSTRSKGRTHYTSYTLAYTLLGKRRLEAFADLALAEAAGEEAIKKIANGEQMILELCNADRLIYLRAKSALASVATELDVACQEYAAAITELGGSGTLLEAIRFFRKAHNVKLPKVTLEAAVDEMLTQAQKDGKSHERRHQLKSYLDRLKQDFGGYHVTDLTSKLLSDFIVALNVKERTKKNCRDVLTAFVNWCVGRGYLAKGQNLMEHVQSYKNKRIGSIQIFTPEELIKLLAASDDRLKPYLAIQAFAGIRGRELQRLDWADIDLTDGFIEVRDSTAKTDVRRLVPIKSNLKKWLVPLAKKAGHVCAIKNLSNALTELSADSGVPWKKNGLRHSYISYRVAECADLPRVADESGNSVSVIRTNYLKRVKPAQASVWFNIMPAESSNQKDQGTPAVASSK